MSNSLGAFVDVDPQISHDAEESVWSANPPSAAAALTVTAAAAEAVIISYIGVGATSPIITLLLVPPLTRDSRASRKLC